MPYERPSLQTIIDRIIADFNSRVDNSQTFLRRSVFRIMGAVYGAACHLLYGFINWVKDQLFISSADAEFLDRHGAEYGIYKSAGAKATGNLNMTGTAGTSIPAGSELQTADGLQYRTDVLAAIGAGGTESVAITAKEVGNDYNQTSGTILTFVAPIDNVTSTCSVDANGLTGGDDEESDEEYRSRLLLRKRYPPHGGIEIDYVRWALEYPGVTRGWTVPQYQGPGTIGLVVVLDDEADIFPDDTIRTALRNYIISHTDPVLGRVVGIPVTAEPGFFVIDGGPYTMNFNIELYPNTGAVQTAIQSNLEDMIKERGGPGNTITISQMYEAITTASGEIRTRITFPTTDVAAATNQVHVFGNINWSDYSG